VVTVTIQIVTYNSSKTIEMCLSALLSQKAVDFDVLILDNDSTDDTVRRVEACGVECRRNAKNAGYAVAHNQLLSLSNSEFVLTLNPDVRLEPTFLCLLVSTLQENPHLGSACGALLRVNALKEQITGEEHIDSLGVYMRRNRRQGLIGDGLPLSAMPAHPLPIFGPDGAAALYRRAMLEDIRIAGEVFDEDFFMHKEDIDICWRAQWRGWQALSVPGAMAQHIRGFRPGRRHGVAQTMRYLGVRNRYLLMLKNDAPQHFLRDLPYIAAYDLKVLAYILLFERRSMRAYGSTAKLLQRMRDKRRYIQANKRVDWREIKHWFMG